MISAFGECFISLEFVLACFVYMRNCQSPSGFIEFQFFSVKNHIDVVGVSTDFWFLILLEGHPQYTVASKPPLPLKRRLQTFKRILRTGMTFEAFIAAGISCGMFAVQQFTGIAFYSQALYFPGNSWSTDRSYFSARVKRLWCSHVWKYCLLVHHELYR